MQFDASAGQRTRTATDLSDDTDITRRTGTAPGSRPACADDQMERDRTEADLLTREQLFRTTFERAAIGIAHSSPDGCWLRVNQRFCDMLGYSREELATRTFQDVTYPDDLAASLTCLRRLLAGELDVCELDKRYLRKDGTLIWVHLTVSLLRTPAGAPDYFISMVQDIAERKRLEQEREAAYAEAEATNAQLRALQALTDTALSHLALDDLLHELLDRVTAVMGVDHVGIFLVDADGQALTIRAARGLLVEHVGQVQIPVGQGVAGRVAASREPLIVDDLSTFAAGGPRMRKHLRSAASVPLLVEGRVAGHLVSRLVGVLTVGSVTPRRFTQADVPLLQRAADRIALAVDRARLYANEQEARRQAQASEARAAARAEQLHTILETITDGVVVYDTAGQRVQTNRAYRELYAVERLQGFEAMSPDERMALLGVRDPTTGEPLTRACSPVGRALRGEVVTGTNWDNHVRALDGRELEVNSSAAPLREPDGRVAGAVLVVRDMTERNRLAREREAARADELAAHEANRRMEQFLAIAAHDLRSPLTATIGYLDLAQRQFDRLAAAVREALPALASQMVTVRQQLEDADHSAERLTRLVTLLFDTSALHAGRLELHRAPCDLAALAREQVAGQRVATPDRVIRLHVPEGKQPIPVEVDADRIGQVITNFVTNALKYSTPDMPVDVSVIVRQGRAHVAICDRGPGIPEGERARIWELFHRVPGVTAQSGTQSGSLGLGLHISKAIVEAHGGRVGVKSAVGKGSTFWFSLPLSPPTPGPTDVAP